MKRKKIYNEIEELENELENCKSGDCLYKLYSMTTYCEPHDYTCGSGIDENGDVYCDRLQRKLAVLLSKNNQKNKKI